MKKTLTLTAIALAAVILTGCSHNPAVFTFGKQLKIGTTEYGEITYLNGVAIVDVSRENSSWEMEINDEEGISVDEKTGTVKGIKTIRRTIGKQVTGYLNDLAEKSPEAVAEYLKEAEAAK